MITFEESMRNHKLSEPTIKKSLRIWKRFGKYATDEQVLRENSIDFYNRLVECRIVADTRGNHLDIVNAHGNYKRYLNEVQRENQDKGSAAE